MFVSVHTSDRYGITAHSQDNQLRRSEDNGARSIGADGLGHRVERHWMRRHWLNLNGTGTLKYQVPGPRKPKQSAAHEPNLAKSETGVGDAGGRSRR